MIKCRIEKRKKGNSILAEVLLCNFEKTFTKSREIKRKTDQCESAKHTDTLII